MSRPSNVFEPSAIFAKTTFAAKSLAVGASSSASRSSLGQRDPPKRINHAFLSNTVASVTSHNRRDQEESCWREKRLKESLMNPLKKIEHAASHSQYRDLEHSIRGRGDVDDRDDHQEQKRRRRRSPSPHQCHHQHSSGGGGYVSDKDAQERHEREYYAARKAEVSQLSCVHQMEEPD